MEKNLLAGCTALIVRNFPMTHTKVIGSIMMRTAPCSTNACAFNSQWPSISSFVWASFIAKNLATTSPFGGDAGVFATTAPAGCCASCVGGVSGIFTPCVVVAGTPVLFVRSLINTTSPTMPCPVACYPAAAMVKPGFTRAIPPDGGPPIRVVSVLTTRPSNGVPLALVPSFFVFGGWD